jgi:hypothetical protein
LYKERTNGRTDEKRKTPKNKEGRKEGGREGGKEGKKERKKERPKRGKEGRNTLPAGGALGGSILFYLLSVWRRP